MNPDRTDEKVQAEMTSEHDGSDNPTLHDVARQAGVSIASVSRVLNNVPPISEGLRSQVESAVQQLGYRMKRSGVSVQPTVAVMIGDAHNTYFAEIMSGIENVADGEGIMTNIIVNRSDPDFPARFSRWISRSSALGLIICSSGALTEDDLLRLRKTRNLPIATINRPTKVDGIPSIRIDYAQAMETAVRHAVKFRHTRIAFLNGRGGAYSSVDKYRGVGRALRKFGCPLSEELHVERTSTIEGGFQAMNAIFDLPPERRPTAVIASNDLMALGAMHAIRARGLSIPDDMTIIGFDDIAMAAHANPPLSTISPPKFEMGARAMQAILDIRDKEAAPRDEYVVMESPLVVRGSSGLCPE